MLLRWDSEQRKQIVEWNPRLTNTYTNPHKTTVTNTITKTDTNTHKKTKTTLVR